MLIFGLIVAGIIWLSSLVYGLIRFIGLTPQYFLLNSVLALVVSSFFSAICFGLILLYGVGGGLNTGTIIASVFTGAVFLLVMIAIINCVE